MENEQRRPRILVVDDDDSFRRSLVDMLSEVGYDGKAVANPLEAVDLLADGSFDAVLLDLVMPEVSGTDLAAELRLTSPDTPILILTGHADVDSAIEGIHHGVFDYLRKDTLGLGRLRHVLHNATAHGRLTRDKADLVRRLQESHAALQAVDEISGQLSVEPDVQRLLQRLASAVKQHCGCEASRAVLLKPLPNDGWLISMTAGDDSELILGARLQRGEGIATAVALEGIEVALAKPQEHERFSPRCDQLPTSLPGFACVPLRHGLAFGALAVAGARAGSFDRERRILLSRLAVHAAVAVDNTLQHERAVNFFTHTCDLLVTLLDGLDVSYTGHSRRVAALSDMLTRRLGLSDTERRHVHFGALLHDIGKMRVGLDILAATGLLSDSQRQLVRHHPSLGVEILRPITQWEEILMIVQLHHERWDGKGYPHGLAGEAIPLGARVVAVAEVFEAMTRRVPLPPGRTPAEALAEIGRLAETQFDPRIARLFIGEYEQYGDQVMR
jgi:putative nucleotidyltransferase with HDIG domain